MEIIVGRKGNQPFSITDKSVSGKHLKLTTLPNGNVEVEDLGSSNGTFIDGVRIIKKVVNRNTVIRLGSSYLFKVCDVLPVVPNDAVNAQQGASIQSKQIPEFSIVHLRQVWDDYDDTLAKIEERRMQMSKKRMLPMMIGSAAGVLSAVFTLVFQFGNIVSVPVALISFYLYFKSYREKDTSHDDKKAAKDFLIQKYVCPNPECHRSLPHNDYSLLSQTPNCPFCKCKWTTK